MLFVARFTDKPGIAEKRAELLDAHFAWLAANKDRVLIAGSLRSDVGGDSLRSAEVAVVSDAPARCAATWAAIRSAACGSSKPTARPAQSRSIRAIRSSPTGCAPRSRSFTT